MKKLMFLISMILIGVLFSGCCHFWFYSAPHHGIVVPGPGIIKP